MSSPHLLPSLKAPHAGPRAGAIVVEPWAVVKSCRSPPPPRCAAPPVDTWGRLGRSSGDRHAATVLTSSGGGTILPPRGCPVVGSVAPRSKGNGDARHTSRLCACSLVPPPDDVKTV